VNFTFGVRVDRAQHRGDPARLEQAGASLSI
jgi:hypothetical protein